MVTIAKTAIKPIVAKSPLPKGISATGQILVVIVMMAIPSL